MEVRDVTITHREPTPVFRDTEGMISAVQAARDGWCIEVVDQQGRQHVFWLEHPDCIPKIGDRVRCYAGRDDDAFVTLEASVCPLLVAERVA